MNLYAFTKPRSEGKRQPSRITAWLVAIALAATCAATHAGIRYVPAESTVDDDVSAVASRTGEGSGDATPAASSGTPRRLIAADLTKMRWERSYGGDRSDLFNDVVVRRTDFAVIAAGASMSRSSGRKDAWIVAADADGRLLWERSIGGAMDEEAHAIIDIDGGDVIVAGTTASDSEGGGAGIVYRLDVGGAPVWRYAFDGPDADQLRTIVALDNGDLVAAGKAGNLSTVIVRLTSAGEAVWEKTYDNKVPQVVTQLLLAPNGDLFVVGESTQLFDSDGAIARISSAGEVLWYETFGSSGNDSLTDGVLLRDGDLLVVGETFANGSSDGWIARVSPAGEMRWEKTVGAEGRDSLQGVTVRADQTLIAAGVQAADDFSVDNAWVVEFADDGSVSRAQSYGGEFSEGFNAISSRSDGAIVTVGFRHSWHDEPSNAYATTIGSPIERIAMRSTASVNPPVVFMPGEGKMLTDRSSVEVLGNVIHDKPIQQLFVDGRPVKVLQNGAFTARVAVPLGTTRLSVEAVDGNGAVGSAEIVVTRVEQGSIGVSNLAALRDRIQFGNYHAVVIGNNFYSGDLPELETAARDAQAIASTLEADFGFDVELLINAKHDEIIAKLEEKSAKLREDDNLLVYYAGHGYYDEDVDVGYWLPVDASLDSKDNWIRNSTITDSIKGMSAKHVMLVADSCFSGTLLRSVEVRRSGRFYERMASRSARLVMTSGGVEPVMDGGGDGHSVFARSFLDKLRGGEEIIDGTSLFQAVREPVILASEQVPQYSNIRFVDSDGGDFLFVRKES